MPDEQSRACDDREKGYKWWQWAIAALLWWPVLAFMIAGTVSGKLRPKLSFVRSLLYSLAAVVVLAVIVSLVLPEGGSTSEVQPTIQSTPKIWPTTPPYIPVPTPTNTISQKETVIAIRDAENLARATAIAKSRSPTALPSAPLPRAPRPTSAPTLSPDMKCLRDANCISKRSDWAIDGKTACTWAVERLARYDMRWTDGFLGDKFPNVHVNPPEYKTFLFSGESAQFQNGFGAWQNVFYACEYDPINDKVVDAAVEGK